MVKFGKNKLKLLNKLEKRQNTFPSAGNTNKILKKKINAGRKVSFQKDVLLKEMVSGDTLVTPVSKVNLLNKVRKAKNTHKLKDSESPKTKLKPVEKQKKRQKIQIADTQLLLSLMKKKN